MPGAHKRLRAEPQAPAFKDSEDAAPAPGGKAHRTDGVEQLEASDLLTPLQPLAEEAADSKALERLIDSAVS